MIHVEVQGYRDIYFAKRFYECSYRIRDKFQRAVTGLAIYTDRNRKYHFKEFNETFFGSEVNYKFNTYVLLDHLPSELAKDQSWYRILVRWRK